MKALLAKLVGVSSSLLNFYLPILRRLAVSGMAALLPVALEIVRSLAKDPIPNDQKFNVAVSKLKEVATAKGIEAGESLLRYTIESAVQRLRD